MGENYREKVVSYIYKIGFCLLLLGKSIGLGGCISNEYRFWGDMIKNERPNFGEANELENKVDNTKITKPSASE